MLSLKVINLWSAPGTGKSTTAAGLFNIMKMHGHSVEYVAEVAKDLVWSKDWMGLSHQPSIFGAQDYRLRRLEGQVEWAITDSPLPMACAYLGEEWGGLDGWLADATWHAFDRYHNVNVLLHRNPGHKYDPKGRMQESLEESMKLDNVIDCLFSHAEDSAVASFEELVDHNTCHRIYHRIINHDPLEGQNLG